MTTSETTPSSAEAVPLTTVTFVVPGLDCPDEVRLIEEAWGSLDGVLEVRTNLLERTAMALIDPAKAPPEALKKVLALAGLASELAPPPRPPEVSFHIPSIEVDATIERLLAALRAVGGTGNPVYHPQERSIRVSYDPSRSTPSELHQALLATGTVVQLVEEGPSRPLRLMEESNSHNGDLDQATVSSFVPPPEPTGGIFVAPAATASEPKASVAIDDR
ncbi:MAG: heavy-metal-associated domain-containing protein, partial [bacterium]